MIYNVVLLVNESFSFITFDSFDFRVSILHLHSMREYYRINETLMLQNVQLGNLCSLGNRSRGKIDLQRPDARDKHVDSECVPENPENNHLNGQNPCPTHTREKYTAS